MSNSVVIPIQGRKFRRKSEPTTVHGMDRGGACNYNFSIQDRRMYSTYANKQVMPGERKVLLTSSHGGDVKASPLVKFLLGGSVAWGYEFVLGQ